MIRQLKNGKFRLYSKNVDAFTGKRTIIGTYKTRAAAIRARMKELV